MKYGGKPEIIVNIGCQNKLRVPWEMPKSKWNWNNMRATCVPMAKITKRVGIMEDNIHGRLVNICEINIWVCRSQYEMQNNLYFFLAWLHLSLYSCSNQFDQALKIEAGKYPIYLITLCFSNLQCFKQSERSSESHIPWTAHSEVFAASDTTV